MVIRQGDVYWIDFGEPRGEQLLEWGERLLTARRPEDLFAT